MKEKEAIRMVLYSEYAFYLNRIALEFGDKWEVLEPVKLVWKWSKFTFVFQITFIR